MSKTSSKIQAQFLEKNHWVVTGAAGFIGSNLVEALIKNDQIVYGIDNLSTGHIDNINRLKALSKKYKNSKFKFLKIDITNLNKMLSTLKGCRADFILHQAALGSVPRSIKDPLNTNNSNVNGFLNILELSKILNIKKLIYASSSSVYGDELSLPKVEQKIGNPLSPYAVSKRVNELYAQVYGKNYEIQTIGLRYFNVFGPWQDPNGPYAAVIPRWIESAMRGKDLEIYGDGKTSRDFCYIDNVVAANFLAAFSDKDASNKVFNIACNDKVSLNKVSSIIINTVKEHTSIKNLKTIYLPFRDGDIRHSIADISLARKYLNYEPKFYFNEAIQKTILWYLNGNK
jgi:UDP-N-acetylglucosamine 4-epimerase